MRGSGAQHIPGQAQSVEVVDVTKAYRDSVAVGGISLAVQPGEFMTLLGPSGSGKTTLLNILAGFTAPDQGRVKFGGKDVTLAPPERRDLGMVFQSYSLFPHMTVAENVTFPLRMRGVPRSEWAGRTEQALSLVRLGELAARKPSELSGGQQQRVAFARAVAGQPGVLLMDEPLAALDLKLRDAMQGEIAYYRGVVGATFIYVTHDQGEAMRLSDRIAVMDRGLVVQVGTPEDIYDRPATRFVAGFVGQANLLGGHVTAGAVVLDDCDAPLPRVVTRPASGPVVACLRPEHLRRHGDGSALPVTIQGVHFQGDHRRYVAETRSGVRVTFAEPRGNDTLETGGSVTLRFDPAHVVLVDSGDQPSGTIQGG